MKFQQFMNNSLLMGLYKNYHHFFRELQKDLKEQGLNLNESLVLLALFFENSKQITPSELSQTLLIKKDQISHALNSLNKKELIEKGLSSKDARMTYLQITNEGKKKASQLVKIFDSSEAAFENTQTPLK